MKKKIVTIILIVIIIVLIILFSILYKKSGIKDYNLDINIEENKDNLTGILQNKTNDYEIKKTSNYVLSSKEKKQVIKAAEALMEAYNSNDDNQTLQSFIANVESKEVRIPSSKLGDSVILGDDFKDWQKNNSSILAFAYMVVNRKMSYKEIKDSVITYSSKERSIVKVYIDDYSVTYGDKEYNIDGIFEMEVVYEKESSMYKVNKFAVEWVKDLKDYLTSADTNERTTNNNAAQAKTSTYIPDGYSSLDYSKLKKLSSTVTNKIYEDNKDSVVVLDAVNEGGTSTGYSTGFFIKSGIVITSYDTFYNMIENGAERIYVDINGSVSEISGVVSAYPSINIVILKLKKETGKPVTINYSYKIEQSDPVIIISSKLGLTPVAKTGIYFDKLEDDIKIMRTSLPLQDGDDGSPIFNTEGQVIGINNNVSSSNDTYISGLNNSLNISELSEVIKKINKTDFKDIEVTSIKDLNKDKKQVVNNVSKKIMNKYKKLTTIDQVMPLDLYSAYTSNKYLIIRYTNNNSNIIDNDTLIKLYEKELISDSYKEISDGVYKKDKITIRVSNNLGFIGIIVEGVV